MNDKQTGSFYTPRLLVNYMVDYALNKAESPIKTVLEPSVGDGRFLDVLRKQPCEIDAIEIDLNKIKKLQGSKNDNLELICSNFIDYAMNTKQKYNLIIGNPPYISKKTLSESEREKSLTLIREFKLPDPIFQNLWVAFVLGALRVLEKENGAIFFVLPFEFLQVHYAERLRNFLEERFNFIEIITFKESVFTGIDQDVCLVYLTNKKNNEPIVSYKTVNNINEFRLIEQNRIERNKPLKKWSNAMLHENEIDLMMRLSNKYKNINDFGKTSPGIVTGANNFFILNNEEKKGLAANVNTVPIIQKGSSIPNLLLFTKEDENNLFNSERKSWMLNLSGINYDDFSVELKNYIEKGVGVGFHKRYKCSQRKRWFDVPIVSPGNVIFFKRYDRTPKLVVNKSGIYTTDITYNIKLLEQYDGDSFAFCFYNSLTLALCEYNGRFYGGGVGELVPSEFKSLAIPYKRIKNSNINKLDSMIRDNVPLQEIVNFVDSIVLADLHKEYLVTLQNIREKYLNRRLKTNI